MLSEHMFENRDFQLRFLCLITLFVIHVLHIGGLF